MTIRAPVALLVAHPAVCGKVEVRLLAGTFFDHEALRLSAPLSREKARVRLPSWSFQPAAGAAHRYYAAPAGAKVISKSKTQRSQRSSKKN